MPGKHTLAAHKKQSIAEKPDEHKSHARHPVSCATASARRGRHPMLFDQRFDRCDQRAQRLASMGDRVLLGRLHFGGRELFAGIDRTLRLIVRHKQRIVAETVGTARGTQQHARHFAGFHDFLSDRITAIGACACTGGVFQDCYNVVGGVDHVIPVDVYVPGCAAKPEAIIDGVVLALEVVKGKLGLRDMPQTTIFE